MQPERTVVQALFRVERVSALLGEEDSFSPAGWEIDYRQDRRQQDESAENQRGVEI